MNHLFEQCDLHHLAYHLAGADVTVHWGQSAHANLDTRQIWLPMADRLGNGDPTQRAARLRGAFYHEIAHLLYTPPWFGQWTDPCVPLPFRNAVRTRGSALQRILMVLEELRVERRLISDYPGLRQVFREQSLALYKERRLRPLSPASIVEQALLTVGRGISHADAPPSVATVCGTPWFQTALDIATMPELLASAIQIHGWLQNRSGEDGVERPPQQQVCLEPVENPPPPAAPTAPLPGAGVDSCGDAPERPYTVWSRACDEVVNYNAADRDPHAAWIQAALRRAKRRVGRRFERIRNQVRQRPTSPLHTGVPHGWLDPEALVPSALGEPLNDPFVDAQSHDPDLAVAMLVDCSGSMARGTPSAADLAREAALLFHAALDDDIPHAIFGFTTSPDGSARLEQRRMSEDVPLKRYQRMTVALQHHVFVDFHEQDANALGALVPQADNIDGESLQWAMDRLLERPEPRKVLLVVSDGRPQGCPGVARHLHEVVREASEVGVELVAIGTGASAAVAKFYPRHHVVKGPEDVPRTLLGVLSGVLNDGRWGTQ